jgi:hypothetical protein
MCGNFKRENRDLPSVPGLAQRPGSGRSANLTEGTADMNAEGKSDGSVVPSTQANKAETESAAESAEERDPAKRNVGQADLHRTPSRTQRRSLGLAGVRKTTFSRPARSRSRMR